jgi:hypothetical protein
MLAPECSGSARYCRLFSSRRRQIHSQWPRRERGRDQIKGDGGRARAIAADLAMAERP